MQSPARAPDRRTAVPLGIDPRMTISASTPLGDRAVSPPASCTPHVFASLSSPRKKRSAHFCGTSAGNARERKAATGSPPIAAMSLKPRARQRCPIDSGECHARRKCTPSRLKSVVTNTSCAAGTRSTEQSSPMPVRMTVLRPAARSGLSSVNLRTRETSCRSGKGKRPQ